MGVPISEMSNLASAANELSDSMATSFAELVRSAGELAPALVQLGYTPDQILAIAAAQNEVNVSVQRGAQRLRSFFQQVGQANREARIADAMKMTREEFTRMSEESPVELFIQIAQASRGLSDEARGVRAAFDSAAEQGIGTFSQNLDRFNIALAMAEREMKENNSLLKQYEEFALSTSAAQQQLNNQIEEAKRRIGEGLLPAKRAWYQWIAGLVTPGFDEVQQAIMAVPQQVRDTFQKELRKAAEEGTINLSDFGIKFDLTTEDMARIRAAGNRAAEGAKVIAREYDEVLGNAVSELHAKLVEDVEEIASEFNISSREMARLTAAYEMFLPLLNQATGEFDENGKAIMKLDYATLTSMVFDMARSFSFARQKIVELREAADFFSSTEGRVLAEWFGLTAQQMSELSASQKSMLRGLVRSRIEITQGADAARRFELELQDLDSAFIDSVVSFERYTKSLEDASRPRPAIVDSQKDLTDAYNRTIFSLENQIVAMVKGEGVARRLALAEEGYNESQIRTIMSLEAKIDKTREANELEESRIDAISRLVGNLEDELREMEMSEEALLRREMALLSVDEATEEHILTIRSRIEALQQEQKELQELTRLEERRQSVLDSFDLSNLETRARFTQRMIENFTDSAIESFDKLITRQKGVAESFKSMLTSMRHELLRITLNRYLFDVFSASLFPGTTGVMPASVMATATGSALANQAIAPSVNVTYNISSIDSRGVSEMIQQSGPQITDIVTKNIRNSSVYRSRLS